MISPFIQNLGKAKGFSQDEQLVLQIALSGILGNKGGSMGGMNTMGGMGGMGGSKSNPFLSMALTLATLLVTHQALQKMSVSQGLQSPGQGQGQGGAINRVSPQSLSLAANMASAPSGAGPQPLASPQKIAPLIPHTPTTPTTPTTPLITGLQAAQNSLTLPSINSLAQSQQAQQALAAMPTINQSQKQKSQISPLYPSPSNP